MKKRTRDLKKHYRSIERQLRNFNIDLCEKSWYQMWHNHLDWEGITTTSNKHRRIHVLYYLKFLDKIEMQAKENKRNFQTWIYLSGDDGIYDAIYFHTRNPYSEFPIRFENIDWDVEIPPILKDLIDLSRFKIGKLSGEEDEHSYIIQKIGLGLMTYH
ncbi:hypothetical protein [Clostridium sp. HMP27]|uniref:hypothetical protein n=1 Tax=Clostridium sp. HMP27 TaxID=1487921 RepID=UPI00052DC329|nr:hypothetical protein [Clostridium sp. HMP27]KGK84818.1 hypothetical protein DP68_16265 [Clostridium sp. HMP27]